MISVAAGDRRLSAPTMEPSLRAAMGESERCPRCGSHNTKFCYYNNYNLAQPRHFCKSCRRYWTLGGTLRNVPIGGSTRSNQVAAPQHATKHPHHSPSPTASSSKRRRASLGASLATVSPFPVPSISNVGLASLAFNVASPTAPDSDAAEHETGGHIVEPAASADILGSFVSLLTEPLPGGGLLPLGDQLVHGRDEEFGLGLGFGVAPRWVTDEASFGLPRPALAWPFLIEDDSAAGLFGTAVVGEGGAGLIISEHDAWQTTAKNAELVGGGYFGWPELGGMATSASGKTVQ